MRQDSDESKEATESIRVLVPQLPEFKDQAASCVYFVKSGFAGVHTESNHRLMYTWAWASPQ